MKSDESVTFYAVVQLGSLTPDDVLVEVYYGLVDGNKISQGESVEMTVIGQHDSSAFLYSATFSITDGGEYGYSFRVVPKHAGLFNKYEMPFMKWATD